MTSPKPLRESPTNPPRRDHPAWLEGLLDRADRTRPAVMNTVITVVVMLSSVIVSLALSALIHPLFGLDPSPQFFGLVAAIGAGVPLIVGVPAVLFGDALVKRVASMREDLREALTAATLASRAKSEFLANISHEIRTPMNGVLGMAQVLEGTDLTAAQREHLRLIRESGDMLMAIIDDVLDLSRIEAGRIDLQPAPHPLARTLGDTVALFAARAAERGNELRFEVAPGTPVRAVFDAIRVRQCLGNLVSNAVKFTSNGHVMVILSARPLAERALEVTLSVTDDGIGISPEAQGRLFEAFAQADGSTVQDYGGTGLGLAISRRLARMMGGDITLTSAQGRGSSFVLRFRAQAADDTAQPAPAGTARKAGGLKGMTILVVDDSAVNRLVATSLLDQEGAICHEAGSCSEALAMLAAHRCDVVLLDMQMPGTDGPATLQAIRGSGQPWAQVPIVALTANAMQGERARCMALGMQGFATKPVRLAALQDEIARSLTGEHRSSRASRPPDPAA